MSIVPHNAQPTLLGCPSCAGVLSLTRECHSPHLQFACSIGHTFSVQSLLEAKENQVEMHLWSLVSLFQHLEMTMDYLLKQVDEGTLPIERSGLVTRREEAQRQGAVVRAIIEETQTPDLGLDG